MNLRLVHAKEHDENGHDWVTAANNMRKWHLRVEEEVEEFEDA